MRSLKLQAALTELIDAAAAHLHAEIAAGAEVPFELESQTRRGGSRSARGSGPSFFSYRALTGEFIAQHAGAIAALASYAPAARLLEGFDGLDRYLAGAGVDPSRVGARARVPAAIEALLCDVFDEQSDFDPSKLAQQPERVLAALERLEQSAFASTSEVTLVATLHGITITSAELALTKGLTIAQPDALGGLPDGLSTNCADGSADHLIVALAAEDEDPHQAAAQGRAVLKDLLRALRLFGDGRVTLGALAWLRVGAGPWSPLALGAGGRPHGMLIVTAEQEDELRAFCNLVSRRAPDGNELAWALRRFELGCERASAYEALSDHLLALRALLEPEGPASGLLAGRLAALCATPARRLLLSERILRAIALERAIVEGSAVEHAAEQELASELADHLRALLRDVICGHLSPDLAGLADEILLAEQEASGGEQMLGDLGEPEEILDLLI
jgi:hypothetical protein